MKIEICSMNIHYRFYDIKHFFESCKKNEIKYAELWLCPHHILVDDKGCKTDINKIKSLAKLNKVKICCICPEQNNPKLYNIAAKDEYYSIRSLNYFKEVIEVANCLGVDKILLTGGWAFYDEDINEAWERSVINMKIICDYAEKRNVNIVVEPLQTHESKLVNSLQSMKKYIDEVNKKNVYIALDIGALAKAGESIQDWFNEFNSKIRHIHYVDGNPTGHLPIGKGTRDIKEDLKQIIDNDYIGVLSFEFASSVSFENPSQIDKDSKRVIERELYKIEKGERK